MPRPERGHLPHSGPGVFEILVREHSDMLMAYLRSLMGRDSGVDDVFQKTMIVAWRRLGDYDRTRPFGPWLRGIAQRIVMEHQRRSNSRMAPLDDAVMAALDERYERLSRLPGDTFRERVTRLNTCMDRLPGAMREAIELVYGRGLKMSVAAATSGANEESVKKRVQRARQMLAECLREGEVT